MARAALGVTTAGIAAVATSVRRFHEMADGAFDRLVLWACIVSRLGLYCLVFLVLRIAPRGDIPAYYVPEGLSVLRGALPYRDFISSYAPLHPYLDAAVLRLWPSALAIILLAIAAECLLLPVWLKLGRRLFVERQLRTAAMLYLASGVSLQFVVIDGQDNVIIALLVAVALLFLYRQRAALSGIVAGLSVVLIKFLPLLYVPAFVAAARRRGRWLAGFAVVTGLGYGAFAALGAPLLEPLKMEASLTGAGNLPYLVESVMGVKLPASLEDGVVLVALLAVLGVVAAVLRGAEDDARLRVLLFATAALTLTLVLLSKKSWPPYLMLALFPMCLSIYRERFSWMRAALFGGFGAVAIVEHSYWSSLFGQETSLGTHRRLMAGDPMAVVMLGLQVLLLSGYGWLLYEALREIVGSGGAKRAIAAGETLE